MIPVAKAAGLDFLEVNVQELLVPDQPATAFQSNLTAMQGTAFPILTANCFLPGHLKCVGPDTDLERILLYAETAFERAARVGIEIIVFGSGASREIPEDFEKGKAEEQFVTLLKALGPRAHNHGVVIAVEHLRSAECNFINSLAEGAALVDRVAHPNIRLLADLFHLRCENQSPSDIEKAGPLLAHVHVAEFKDRRAPGTSKEDLIPYLEALKNTGYTGRIAFECAWEDYDAEVDPATSYFRKQLNSAGY
jgi:sugar phosphate isomerase/epimerase